MMVDPVPKNQDFLADICVVQAFHRGEVTERGHLGRRSVVDSFGCFSGSMPLFTTCSLERRD